jgi:hypothetical protein
VTVSCLITGHRDSSRRRRPEEARQPRRVSRTGTATPWTSALSAESRAGNQQPGGIVEQAVKDILALPPSLQPSEVISLFSLSGPSFRLPDHADHLHVGY